MPNVFAFKFLKGEKRNSRYSSLQRFSQVELAHHVPVLPVLMDSAQTALVVQAGEDALVLPHDVLRMGYCSRRVQDVQQATSERKPCCCMDEVISRGQDVSVGVTPRT